MLLEATMVICALCGLVAAGVSVWSVRDLDTRIGVLEGRRIQRRAQWASLRPGSAFLMAPSATAENSRT